MSKGIDLIKTLKPYTRYQRWLKSQRDFSTHKDFSDLTILAILFIVFVCLFLMVAVVSAEEGTASWYSVASCKREGTWQKYGGKTASGEIFDDKKLTCAMRSRNFGKYYKVTNIKTGKFVIVKHNDFGPNKKLWDKGRKIDLSRSAFEKIENLTKGIVNVKIEPIQ